MGFVVLPGRLTIKQLANASCFFLPFLMQYCTRLPLENHRYAKQGSIFFPTHPPIGYNRLRLTAQTAGQHHLIP